MDPQIKEEGNFRFIEEGEGPVIILLHGLFGALSNFRETLDYFTSHNYKVVIPMLPLYSMPVLSTGVKSISKFLRDFVVYKNWNKVNLLGNSLGGHVALMFNSLPAVLPVVKSGKLHALALAGAKRTPTLPEMPTFAEAGLANFEAGSWYGILAPTGTPRDVVTKLHTETVRILALPDVKQRLASEGAEAIGNTPEEFATQIRHDIARWAKVASEAMIKTQ